MVKNVFFIALVSALIPVLISCNPQKKSDTAIKVEVKFENGKYQLYRAGQPFYIYGAGCEFGDIANLASHGANSFRTWRTENGKDSCITILNNAQKNGLTVLMGLEIARERHGFNYDDTAQVNFAYVFDGKNNAATANVPFFVDKK